MVQLGPALTTVCDHWEDQSLNYTDLCRQCDVSAFNTLSRFVIAFLPKVIVYVLIYSPQMILTEIPVLYRSSIHKYFSMWL